MQTVQKPQKMKSSSDSKPIVKRYIIRKYITATSASEALKKDKNFKADECWVDEKWLEEQNRANPSAIGFAVERDNDY